MYLFQFLFLRSGNQDAQFIWRRVTPQDKVILKTSSSKWPNKGLGVVQTINDNCLSGILEQRETATNRFPVWKLSWKSFPFKVTCELVLSRREWHHHEQCGGWHGLVTTASPAPLARLSPGQGGVPHTRADPPELLRPHLWGARLGRHPPGESPISSDTNDLKYYL